MKIDFSKGGGLVPALIQDSTTLQVLMLGYMNKAAWAKTMAEKRVTFYSRTKERLWTKGEASGHYLDVQDVKVDCDNDTILILAKPHGPTCHTGDVTCFGSSSDKGFVYDLESTISQRIDEQAENSYTSKLYQRGINKIAQKVGEEAVELVIEAMDDNIDLFKGEAADLLYHYLILLKAKGLTFSDIEAVLKLRSQSK